MTDKLRLNETTGVVFIDGGYAIAQGLEGEDIVVLSPVDAYRLGRWLVHHFEIQRDLEQTVAYWRERDD